MRQSIPIIPSVFSSITVAKVLSFMLIGMHYVICNEMVND